MRSREVGCFAAGAVAGGLLALAFKKDRALSGKVLIVRDGSVEAHTRNSELEPKVGGRQRWMHKAEVVQVFGAASPDEACDTPLHEAGAFERVTFELRDQDGTALTLTAAPEGPAGKLHLRPPPSGDWEFMWQGYRYLFKRGGQVRNVRITSVQVIWTNGTMNIFNSPGALCVEFRKD